MSAVHILPDGWRRISLQQIAAIQTGVAKGKKKIKDPIELPYLRVANVQDGHLNLSEIRSIKISRSEVTRYLLQSGDVLMTEGGDFDKLGRGFVWEGQVSQCLHQNHVFVVRADRSHLDPYFLTYQAGSGLGKGYFLSCSKQSTNLASINSSQLKEFPVVLPPLREQRNIVQSIRTWDRAIDLAARMIAAKQERRAWLMQQLLTGNRRLPGFIKPWRAVQLGEFLAESRLPGSDGKSARKITVRLYGLGVLEKSDKRAGSTNTNYHVRKAGQFIYSKLDFLNGAFGLIPRELDGFESTLDLPCFDIAEGLNSKYLLYLVGREAFYSRFLSSAMGGRKARRVSPSEFLAIQVHLPPVTEQAAIVGAIASADREIQLLLQYVDSLKDQKKGLMQQLLTGKRRVKVPKTT